VKEFIVKLNKEKYILETIHKTIKKHAGLSDWDDDAIHEEALAIFKALKETGVLE